MRKLVKAAVGPAVAAIISTCFAAPTDAATKHKKKAFAEPREGQAIVYLVRRGFLGGAVSIFAFADDQLLTVLEGSCYGFAHVDPGDRLLWLSWRPDVLAKRVTLEAGLTYYFDIGTQIEPLDAKWGPQYVDQVNGYCVPTEKEFRTAQKRISRYHGEAEKIADEGAAYAGREGRREANVAKWASVDLNPYSVLCVEDFELSDPKAGSRKKSVQVQSAPARMAGRIVESVEPDLFDQVIRCPTSEPPAGTLVLKGDLTQYKPGSRFGRAMLAGAGSSHLDFTVALLDAETGEELATFGDKKTWAWGGEAGANFGIEELEKNAAYEIALYLKKCKGAG